MKAARPASSHLWWTWSSSLILGISIQALDPSSHFTSSVNHGTRPIGCCCGRLFPCIDHLSNGRHLHRPRDWTVVSERPVGPDFMVIFEVRFERAPQLPF